MKLMRRLAVVSIVTLLAACGGPPPAAPTSQPQSSTPPPPPPPTTSTLSGPLTATNGGRPLPGVTIEAAGVSSTTDEAGRYSLGLPAGLQRPAFVISGPGVLTRRGFFATGGSRTVALNAFALDGFDPAYFRAIARNSWQSPDSLEPLRRWTRAPMIYLRTVDDTGRHILPEVLTQVTSIVSSVVPVYTNGRFGVAGFEVGTGNRFGQPGWITIDWTGEEGSFCGWAHVGLEGGAIMLTYDRPSCSCGSQKIRPRTVKHEVGHALGLWHTGHRDDLMSGIGVSECDRNMSARELEYLDYLYQRSVGNTDPDDEPSSAQPLRSVRVFD